nr:ATP-grasp domain-containing protein [uncultured Actinoplanes sp.]
MSRAVLLVVYDIGSLAPTTIAARAAANDCEPVFVVAPSAHTDEVRPLLEMLGRVVPVGPSLESDLRELRPDGILTFSESQIPRTVRLAALLGLRCHSPEDLPAMVDKTAQRARLAAAGVDALAHRPITTVDGIGPALDAVGLPCIVKPQVGASSRNTFLVTDPAAGHAAIAAVLSDEGVVVAEELLRGRPTDRPWGDYLAVDCVADGTDVRVHFVTGKFALATPFRERAGYGPRPVEDAATVAAASALACRATAALGIRGLSHVEIKLTPDGPRVIEVNGRLGAWVGDLAERSGCTPPADLAIQVALGRPVEVKPPVADGPLVYQYLIIPPVTATTVREIGDIGPLTGIDGVQQVKVLARPGAYVGWETGTAGAVAMVSGTAPDPQALAATVRRIEDADWIRY